MATDPKFLPQGSEPPSPAVTPEPRSAPPRRRGILAIVLISALVGAIAGSFATIVMDNRLAKTTSTGNVLAPLAPVTNNLTEESAVISVADQAGKAVSRDQDDDLVTRHLRAAGAEQGSDPASSCGRMGTS